MTKKEMLEALQEFEETSLQYEEGTEPIWTFEESMEYDREFFGLERELQENPKAGEEEFEAKSEGMKLQLEEMRAWGILD